MFASKSRVIVLMHNGEPILAMPLVAVSRLEAEPPDAIELSDASSG